MPRLFQILSELAAVSVMVHYSIPGTAIPRNVMAVFFVAAFMLFFFGVTVFRQNRGTFIAPADISAYAAALSRITLKWPHTDFKASRRAAKARGGILLNLRSLANNRMPNRHRSFKREIPILAHDGPVPSRHRPPRPPKLFPLAT